MMLARKESPKRINEKTFYESRVKERQLPKLVKMDER